MNLGEKIKKHRMKNSMSQEDLANSLYVHRRTIAKWENNSSIPSIDMLVKLSSIFNISVDELLKDDVKDTVTIIPNHRDDSLKRKYILYIVILIFISSLGILSYRVGDYFIKRGIEINEKLQKEKEEKLLEEQKRKEALEQEKEKSKRDSFNRNFEFYSGTKTNSSVSYVIDKAIENAKKGEEHLIEFTFDNKSYGTNPDSILKIKNYLRDFNNYNIQYYEIQFDYDSNGYIYKANIETR